jgi:hypothetical protein
MVRQSNMCHKTGKTFPLFKIIHIRYRYAEHIEGQKSSNYHNLLSLNTLGGTCYSPTSVTIFSGWGGGDFSKLHTQLLSLLS